MAPTTLATLVAQRTMDAELAALLWLLAEGSVPLVVTGDASAEERSSLAAAVLSADASRGWVLLDADAQMLTTAQLSALVRGGVGLGVSLTATDLRDAMTRLEMPPDGLPEDAVRRLGVVIVAESTGHGLRLGAVHYLRPTERDAQGHLQRRPPAVLATWDATADVYEHFAWGITPELADRVDRSQADLEERQRSRAAFVAKVARDPASATEAWAARVAEHLAAEPPRVPAPEHEPATPSPFHGGVTDPHLH